MANGEQHPISGLMNVTLEKIKQMVDTDTIIGSPITTADGTTILPVNKVSFGFTSGGSDIASSKTPKDLFGGGSGAGVSMQPIAFLVIGSSGSVRLLQLADKSGTVDRALNMLPEVMDLVSGFVNKDKKDKTKAEPQPEGSAGAEAAPAEDAPVDVVEPLI